MSNSIRVLTDEKLSVVSGAGKTNTKDGSYVPGNKWEAWIWDNCDLGLVNDGTGYGGGNIKWSLPADGRPA